MDTKTTYIAKEADATGLVHYTEQEHQVWNELITRQLPLVKDRACPEFLHGLDVLNLPHDRIPQLPEISTALKKETGWSLAQVPAIIPADYFFYLLSQRQFPAATFIRRREELNYLREPDMFHEVFGHCPLLTNQAYADFTHTYGKLAYAADEASREMLARLYWFTIEFGLVQTNQGLRIYGGGILSSVNETAYSLESPDALRKPFEIIDVLRTPFRIDIMQPIYYVLHSFQDLYQLIEADLFSMIRKAQSLKLHQPLFSETKK